MTRQAEGSRAAARVLEAALAAVAPAPAVRAALRLEGDRLTAGDDLSVELAGVERVLLLGAGKAAVGMARGALEALGGRVAGGAVVVPHGSGAGVGGVEVWEAGHPLPDAHGLAAAGEALRLARAAGPRDLVVCLLSGGASALWPAPPAAVSLGDLRLVTERALRAGVPIGELNAVRKHLSLLAGGGLARAAAPARVLTLAVSDVVGAPPDAIGSGPTLPDPTTHAQAMEVLLRHGVDVPPAVRRHLQAGMAGAAPETAGPGELGNLAGFLVVAGVRDALDAAAREAARLGYRAEVVSAEMQGEARAVGAEVAGAALRARRAGGGPVALLWGGETTVAVRGAGEGGRNQELALAAARALEGQEGIVVASFGTDGRDGPTPAAGAVVDGGTAGRGRAAGIDPDAALHHNDSHTFLRASGDLLVTGPTGTNVGDIVLALVG